MSQHQLDSELIRNLASLLDETKLTEIEYQRDNVRIRVARNLPPHSVALPPVSVAAPAPVAVAPVAALAPADHPGMVPSPMVGTVYLAAEPGARPFIVVGDTVQKGQTLLIIEAMKVMNPLPSPRTGVVKEIVVTDGKPVEYGEPLVIIE
jgi:acetyl-CoA carboxylase biotin carboxyl carrier protein